MFKKILLATDGSEHSKRSAGYAVELAEKFAGVIELVYVVSGRDSKTDVLHATDKYALEVKRNEKLQAIKAVIDTAGVTYDTKILHGEPGPEIVEYANEHDFDCVVIGSRGLNTMQEMVLGSVSHKVAKRANCPVLIVK